MVKLNAPKLVSKSMKQSIRVTLLDGAGNRKKRGSKDGNIDEQSARLCLLGMLKHPKHNV